jgi:gamma-glutamyltranspeptidase/glutathione hydrolase
MKTLIVRPLLLLGLLLSPMAWADSPARAERPDGAAIASGHALATQAGIDILAQGGNAFDAAVAVSSTLAVVEPISSGLGGGGFFLLHDAATGKDVMLDARETAPAAATPQAFLDKQGNLDRDRSVNGAWSAGIPACLQRWSSCRPSTASCRCRHRCSRRSASRAKASRSTTAWPRAMPRAVK